MLIPDEILQAYLNIYPKATKHTETFLADRDSKKLSWPSWCYMPVSASYAIVSEEVERNGLPMALAAGDVGNLAALLAWRPTKGVYRFDDDLLQSLWNVDLNKKIPTEVLFDLPEWCCYIDFEGFEPAKAMGLYGFFVYLEEDQKSKEREIRFTFAGPGQNAPSISTMPFHIDAGGGTLGEMLQGAVDFAKKSSDIAEEKLKGFAVDSKDAADIFGKYFSLVLYLCSTGRDIIQTSRKRKISKNPKKKKRRLPVEYRVGSAIGGAIRRARESHARGTGDGTKKSPHIRRAHYHTFWYGKKGQQKPIVKYIAPIPVNIGDEPVMPIVRRVK